MDPTLLASATTTAAAQTIAAAAATATATTAMTRNGQRNGTHRAVNVHGRLMYDEIVINDVWINAILSTLALTCAACVCLCFLYCKFQQWKQTAQQRRNEKNSRKRDDESLPSYTIVTGLPSYDEALERMKTAAVGSKPPATAGQPSKRSPAISVVRVKNETATAPPPPPLSPPPPPSPSPPPPPSKPDPKFGLVSHKWFVHDSGCSHCLSVQELLETYDVR